jgi:hypothetical protein
MPTFTLCRVICIGPGILHVRNGIVFTVNQVVIATGHKKGLSISWLDSLLLHCPASDDFCEVFYMSQPQFFICIIFLFSKQLLGGFFGKKFVGSLCF